MLHWRDSQKKALCGLKEQKYFTSWDEVEVDEWEELESVDSILYGVESPELEGRPLLVALLLELCDGQDVLGRQIRLVEIGRVVRGVQGRGTHHEGSLGGALQGTKHLQGGKGDNGMSCQFQGRIPWLKICIIHNQIKSNMSLKRPLKGNRKVAAIHHKVFNAVVIFSGGGGGGGVWVAA